MDNHQLVCLYMLSQLLERELDKCLRLVVAIPMDMSTFYGKSVCVYGIRKVIKMQQRLLSTNLNIESNSKVAFVISRSECLQHEATFKI